VFSPVVGIDESNDDVVSISVVVTTDDVVGLDGLEVDGTALLDAVVMTVVGFEVVVDTVVGFEVVDLVVVDVEVVVVVVAGFGVVYRMVK
jgi:hypothetical protein